MKTKKSELRHITCSEAYQHYWEQVYKCRPRLSSVNAIDLNLEIISDSNLKILAFRHDLPEDMQGMESNIGLWRLFNEKQMVVEVRETVKDLIAMLRVGSCLN